VVPEVVLVLVTELAPPTPVVLGPAVVLLVPVVVPVEVTAPAWQLPATQLWPTAQALPQTPQFAASFKTPVGQVQLPWLHCWPGSQAVPHVPQFMGSLAGLVQPPLQLVSPALHSAEHARWLQTSAAAHGVPQAPQLS